MGRSEETVVDGIDTEDTDVDESPTAAETDDEHGRLSGLFSLKAFLLSGLVIGLGVGIGGAIPFVGTIGSFVGLFLATFLTGLIASQRRYLETAVAGGSIVGLSFAVSLLTTGVLPVGMQFFREYGLIFGGVGVALGAGLGVVGHYFGRDLRDGLTQEI